MDFTKLAQEGQIKVIRDQNDQIVPVSVYESWDDVEKRVIKFG